MTSRTMTLLVGALASSACGTTGSGDEEGVVARRGGVQAQAIEGDMVIPPPRGLQKGDLVLALIWSDIKRAEGDTIELPPDWKYVTLEENRQGYELDLAWTIATTEDPLYSFYFEDANDDPNADVERYPYAFSAAMAYGNVRQPKSFSPGTAITESFYPKGEGQCEAEIGPLSVSEPGSAIALFMASSAPGAIGAWRPSLPYELASDGLVTGPVAIYDRQAGASVETASIQATCAGPTNTKALVVVFDPALED